jgi:hypothetical protein
MMALGIGSSLLGPNGWMAKGQGGNLLAMLAWRSLIDFLTIPAY